jgi:hypothetical protein
MDALIISALIIGSGFLTGFVIRDRAVRRRRRMERRLLGL